jgi:hypothetical protein
MNKKCLSKPEQIIRDKAVQRLVHTEILRHIVQQAVKHAGGDKHESQ